jgi:hypothetical protein
MPIAPTAKSLYSDVLTYANDVIHQGQSKVHLLLQQAKLTTASATESLQQSRQVQQLQQSLNRASVAVLELRAHASAALNASKAPASQAAVIAQQFVSGVSLRELPASAYSFVAQSLGVCPKDAHYEQTVAHLRELLQALRQVVVDSAAAAAAPIPAVAQSVPEPDNADQSVSSTTATDVNTSVVSESNHQLNSSFASEVSFAERDDGEAAVVSADSEEEALDNDDE